MCKWQKILQSTQAAQHLERHIRVAWPSITVPPPWYPSGSLPPMSSTNLSCPSSNMSFNMKKVSKRDSPTRRQCSYCGVNAACSCYRHMHLGCATQEKLWECCFDTSANRWKLKNIVVELCPWTFTYKKLSKATKSFSAKEFLGRGFFGSLYTYVQGNSHGY